MYWVVTQVGYWHETIYFVCEDTREKAIEVCSEGWTERYTWLAEKVELPTKSNPVLQIRDLDVL